MAFHDRAFDQGAIGPFSNAEIRKFAAPAETIAAEQSAGNNPFAAGPDLGERALQVLSRALRMPLGLLSEALGTPLSEQQNRSRSEQRFLGQHVSGEEVPFSAGRRAANIFSLGLFPGNQSGRIDPSGLDDAQRERLEGLTPLQQRLVTAGNPEDFASLLSDESIFDPPQPLTDLGARRIDAQNIRGVAGDIDQSQAQIVGAGDTLRVPNQPDFTAPLAAGEGENIFDDPTFLASTLKLYTSDSVGRARQSGRISDLQFREGADVESIMKKAAAEKVSQSNFLAITKRYRDRADEYRSFIGTFGQDPKHIPKDIAIMLQRAGVDFSTMSDSGIRDVALIFQFMRMLDPTSVVRESEFGLAVDAQGLPPSIRGKLNNWLQQDFQGEFLSDEVRNEIFRTISDLVESNFRGQEIARTVFRAAAVLQNENPDNVTLGEGLNQDIRRIFGFLRDGDSEGFVNPKVGVGGPIDAPREVSAADAKLKVEFIEGGGDPDNPAEVAVFFKDKGLK